MAAAPMFGTQSWPIELEIEEEEEDDDLRSVGRKPKQTTSTLQNSATDITTMNTLPSGLEIVLFNNPPSVVDLSASRNSVNPKVTAPVSPSIEDLANPRLAESGNHSPGELGNPGFTEGLDWALDDATHGDTLPGASGAFKRLTKGRGGGAGHVKAEEQNGAIVRSLQKSELEHEMELFEAAEREEKALLPTSLCNNQSGHCSPSSKSPTSMESSQVDCKRGPGVGLEQQPQCKRKRKAGVNYQALSKEEDVCFKCYDGGVLVLCDKRLNFSEDV